MNLFHRILLYATTLVAATLLVMFLLQGKNPKIAYVDIGKLTNEYQLKKDLEQTSSQNLLRIKSTIDSLKLVQKMTPVHPAPIDTTIQRAEYAFDQYYSQSNQEMSKKVWERLNPLLQDYGKEKHMELIIGANGAGTVLYGNEQKDVTADVIKYINEKYTKGS